MHPTEAAKGSRKMILGGTNPYRVDRAIHAAGWRNEDC